MRGNTYSTGQDLVFESYGEALGFAAKPLPKDAIANAGSRREKTDENWYGTKTFGEAMTLAQQGWEAGRANMAKLSSALVDKLGSQVKRDVIHYDVEGVECDVAMALTGVPEFMMRWETVTARDEGQILKVLVNTTASSGVDAKVILARGAVLTALIELLEMSGRRVELEIGFKTAMMSGIIPIKYADQPLDMGRVAFALAHPSMLRRIQFGIWDQFPKIYQAGYGMPMEFDADGYDLYCPTMTYGEKQWTSDASAQKWILETLKTQGVALV